MANKHRCEVAFDALGEGNYIRFHLDDLAQLEDEYGQEFFDKVEESCSKHSTKVILKCLQIGLKRKSETGVEIAQYDNIDFDACQGREKDPFVPAMASEPILEAICEAWLGKSYKQVIKDAQKAQVEFEIQEAEARKKQLTDALGEAQEVAKEAGVPFDAEASSELLSTLLENQVLGKSELGG